MDSLQKSKSRSPFLRGFRDEPSEEEPRTRMASPKRKTSFEIKDMMHQDNYVIKTHPRQSTKNSLKKINGSKERKSKDNNRKAAKDFVSPTVVQYNDLINFITLGESRANMNRTDLGFGKSNPHRKAKR